MTVAYNEIDGYAVEYMRWLMVGGLIAPGHIFTCSIEDLTPSDVSGFDQFHAFAGMGVWSYALRQLGWHDDRRIWTGSCPCQPFSAAGKGGGFADERHLWPAFFHLITNCRPERVAGEQVADRDGLTWLDLVSSDMEAASYAFRAVPLCSAGFGSPDIRNRTYWMGDAHEARREGVPNGSRLVHGSQRPTAERTGGDAVEWVADAESGQQRGSREPGSNARSGEQSSRRHGADRGLALPNDAERRPGPAGRDERDGSDAGWAQGASDAEGRCGPGGVADPHGRLAGHSDLQRSGQHGQQPEDPSLGDGHRGPGPLNGFWRNADWLRCRDDKWRPVEPGTFPLVTGAPSRVGRLRAMGNSLNAQAAIEFLRAALSP